MNACYALELISMKMRRQVLWSVNAQLDRVQGKLCVGFVTHMQNVPFRLSLSVFLFSLTRKYIIIYLLYNCLSKLATHAVSEDQLKEKSKLVAC